MLAYIRSKSISTVGYHGIHVKYARKTNYTGAATEKMVVEWSLDNGSNWQPALESTADTAWAYKDWTLPSTADGKTTIKVRFSGGWDNSTKFAYVDGVEIAGTPN